MSDEQKTFTEALVRERERAAFIAGAFFEDSSLTSTLHLTTEAARRYPAPTKPRVVNIGGYDCAVIDGTLRYRYGPQDKWKEAQFQLRDLAALNDLLAHPEEPCNE